jgi:YesN/AraC family two-component response regulator
VVLVVDDEPGVLAAFTLVLEKDYEVLTAEDGPEALKIVESGLVDAVLLDLLMPRMHGLEVLVRMRARDARLEVILVSAVHEIPMVVEGMRRGAVDYIPKPVDDHVVLAAVRQAVTRRRSQLDGVLLAGAELGQLATLEILLARDMTVAIIEPHPDSLRRFTDRPPALLVLDLRKTTVRAEAFVRSVREHLPAASLMVVTPDLERTRQLPGLGTLPAAHFVEKPASLDELLQRITRLSRRTGPSAAPRRPMSAGLMKALEYVSAHYAQSLLVSDIADASGLSDDRLAHLFRETPGMAVKDYVMRLRVTVARELLRDGRRTLEDVAQQAGFTDASHFSRVFAGTVGTRPGAYRRQPPAWPSLSGAG